MEVMETNVLCQPMSGGCTDHLQISKSHEHSRNSLNRVAGVALQRRKTEKVEKVTFDVNRQETTSKDRKHLEN